MIDVGGKAVAIAGDALNALAEHTAAHKRLSSLIRSPRIATVSLMRRNAVAQMRKPMNGRWKRASFVALLCLTASTAYAQTGPFAAMAGIWFGRGRIDLSDGQSEPIRCRARYDVLDRGTLMRQRLRCASASSVFDVQSDVVYQGGAISGSWSEATRNINGQVTGTVSRGRVSAQVSGGLFTADLSLVTHSNTQEVTIIPRGSDVREVAVSLRRR
jgi:hypothetical protein